MANEKWSAFTDAGQLTTGDKIVGLRSGANVRLDPILPSQVQQAAFNTGTDTGVANAYVLTLNPAISGAIPTGLTVIFLPAHNNTIGAPTININGGFALPIKLPNGDALLAL
jgi:hypothetical protein